MSDPLDQLKQWREITDDATPGEWWGARGLPDVFAGPGLSSDIAVATDVRQPDSKFIVLAHYAMPALLAAVENVLKLAERERSAIRATYAPDVPYHQYANAMDDVVTAIRDALGGAK